LTVTRPFLLSGFTVVPSMYILPARNSAMGPCGNKGHAGRVRKEESMVRHGAKTHTHGYAERTAFACCCWPAWACASKACSCCGVIPPAWGFSSRGERGRRLVSSGGGAGVWSARVNWSLAHAFSAAGPGWSAAAGRFRRSVGTVPKASHSRITQSPGPWKKPAP
jgi:hypothetical protein